MRRSEFKTLVTIGIIGAILAASIYGGYIDFTPSTVSTDEDDDLDTTTTVTIENPYNLPDGMSIDAASYIIFKNGTLTCAKNGMTGYTEFVSGNSTAIIQATIDSMSSGGMIYIKSGTYLIDSSIELADNVAIVGEGQTVLNYTSSTGSMFSTEQSFSTAETTLTADAGIGDMTINVTSATGLTAGQYVKIVTDDTITGTAYRRGEINQIRSITGTTITLVRSLDDEYGAADPTRVRALDLTSNISFQNLDLIGSGIEKLTQCLYGWNINNMEVVGCHIAEWGECALSFYDSIDVWVTSCTFENNFYTGLGYSIAITDCSERMKIVDNVFRYYGRHYIATGTTESIGDLPGGMYRDLYISGNTFESSPAGQEAINNHLGAYGSMSIVGNVFKDCGKGIEVANSNAIISSNVFINNGIGIHTGENSEGRHVLIEGNRFDRHEGAATAIKVHNQDVSIIGNVFTASRLVIGEDAENITIQNNQFSNLADANQIEVIGTSDDHVKNILIQANSFFSCGTTGAEYTIKARYVENITIISNSLRLSSRLVIDNCDSAVLIGNEITTPNSHAIEFTHSSNFVAANNVILYGPSRGISLTSADDADTPVYITANILNAATPFYNDTSYTNVTYWQVGY